ncbi:hypothetical protein VP242E401_P0029 [Vibrio phage 242E40-1]|nr:hypothetical protein VP242E401_P0029 [Vibrio phage 242E40-1]
MPSILTSLIYAYCDQYLKIANIKNCDSNHSKTLNHWVLSSSSTQRRFKNV